VVVVAGVVSEEVALVVGSVDGVGIGGVSGRGRLAGRGGLGVVSHFRR
jgi:hypothetical protein